MYQKVKAYVEKHHMLKNGDKVIVGVSGGADSICLLFMLLALQEEINFEILAAHVHHGLRKESADADERYVRKICEKQEVELRVFHEDVKTYAKKYGLTEEEAGRNIRREVLGRLCEEERGTRIALAHHRNDNVETLLWNLARGTGIRGAGGIRPVNGVWIRPLLCVERTEIELYLEKWRISYCTDETNLEDAYTRNRLRNHVIPYFEEHINRRTVEHMAEAVEQFRLLGEYVEAEAEKYRCMCVKENEGRILLNKEAFVQVPEVLKSYVLLQTLGEAAGQKKDIEMIHVNILQELLEKQVGRKINLPYGIQAIRTYEGLELSCGENEAETETENKELKMQMKMFPKPEGWITFPEKTYTKWFDYDIIKRTVKLRHRKSGDYITINKDGGTKKLKQYFVDEKIPQKERDNIWLLADGSHIMWIIGYRQNQAYQITEKTKNILEVKIDGGGEKWQKQ